MTLNKIILNGILERNFEWNLYLFIYLTALFMAVKDENVEIVQLLLSNDKINVNIECIYNVC